MRPPSRTFARRLEPALGGLDIGRETLELARRAVVLVNERLAVEHLEERLADLRLPSSIPAVPICTTHRAP